MKEYVVAIPSYSRADQLTKKTLQTLHNLSIPKEKIFVFIVQDQEEEYIAKTNPEYFHKFVIGEKGIVAQREFIENYFPEGTRIISFDDDIESIDLSLTEFQSAYEFFMEAFATCEREGAFIWSVYPVFNPFFRKARIPVTTGLSFAIGAFYGFINRPNTPELVVVVDRSGNKEDVEKSIRYWKKDGKIVRFNRVGFKTKCFGNGGLGGLNERMAAQKQNALAINEAFPENTRIKIRKNGLYEIVLREHPPKKERKPKKETPLVTETPDTEFLPELQKSETELLLSMLSKKVIPKQTNGGGRSKTFGSHRAVTLGMIKGRVTRRYELSVFSRKNPDIHREVERIGKLICPFEFNAIQVNHNVQCPRHIDPYNSGESVIVAIGDYEGGELIIEDKEEAFDINHKPLRFNGARYYHWNLPITSGNKYSLVFFTSANT